MAKKRTTTNDIANKEHYFNRWIACEILNDYKKQDKIKQHECSLEEKTDGSNEYLLHSTNSIDDVPNAIFSKQLMWIESIENQRLFHAIKLLSMEEKALISYAWIEGYHHTEIALILGITQQAVSKKLARLKITIKKLL